MEIDSIEGKYYCHKCKKTHKIKKEKHFQYASPFPEQIVKQLLAKKKKYFAVRQFEHEQTRSGSGFCHQNKF